MKIWRRKKGKNFVGNWYVGRGPAAVNLGTKNAKVATKRAQLAEQGQWPIPVAEDAAEVAAEAEHVPEVHEEVVDDASSEELPNGKAHVTVPGPAGDPLAEVDPVAAAAVAAGDVGGKDELPSSSPVSPELPVDLAVEMGRELQREYFPEGEEGGGDPGAAGAAILLSIEHAIGQRMASRRDPPRFVPEPDEKSLLFRVTACACRVMGRHYTGELKVHPLWVILGVALVGYPLQMAMTARTEEQIRLAAEAEESKGD